jgi:hypothetical protein
MKAYLEQFLKDFDYKESDAKFLLSEYEKIAKHWSANSMFNNIIAAYEKSIKIDYYNDVLVKAQNAGTNAGVHPYTSGLLIFMCLSKHLKELYDEKGISEEIYHNSMLDLRYKLEECKLVKNIIGSFVAWWFPGFFDMTRFALGRLQFELIPIGFDYEKNGIKLKKDKSIVINVHIPRTGTPLDKESCDASYSQAREFFKKITGEELHFVCRSWLLFPENEKILSQTSNVYRFMSEYDVISFEYNNGEDLWRLFDTDEKNPEKLPTNTSLRMCYANHLKNGGRVGEGYGVRW